MDPVQAMCWLACSHSCLANVQHQACMHLRGLLLNPKADRERLQCMHGRP